jgi:hypothetical protein
MTVYEIQEYLYLITLVYAQNHYDAFVITTIVAILTFVSFVLLPSKLVHAIIGKHTHELLFIYKSQPLS